TGAVRQRERGVEKASVVSARSAQECDGFERHDDREGDRCGVGGGFGRLRPIERRIEVVTLELEASHRGRAIMETRCVARRQAPRSEILRVALRGAEESSRLCQLDDELADALEE